MEVSMKNFRVYLRCWFVFQWTLIRNRILAAIDIARFWYGWFVYGDELPEEVMKALYRSFREGS